MGKTIQIEYFMGLVACDITKNGIEVIPLIVKTEIAERSG
jgi:hypothetical protein